MRTYQLTVDLNTPKTYVLYICTVHMHNVNRVLCEYYIHTHTQIGNSYEPQHILYICTYIMGESVI